MEVPIQCVKETQESTVALLEVLIDALLIYLVEYFICLISGVLILCCLIVGGLPAACFVIGSAVHFSTLYLSPLCIL